ncbi:carbohydrate binding domain-containing protein [Uliginosibacterium sp. 31-16]|uniref:carbohydrate binding domain-containing protein n=1 Tax=Uliginosibacterium sp. 31-16 TaxID=3068315 RepID=UPI00273D455B|nr:carbohydrate binding domain-containing protein [Uliginosibacterium sp. 31-16]MDP5238028.1 carbohydrate binding domain-containing protein [Uliginosibacterium sp. 31-16]
MSRYGMVFLLMLVALGLPAPAAMAGELFPWGMPWDDASANATNLTDWNHRPAGRHGFARVENGHLYAGDERLRLLGVNIVFGSVAPDHATADRLAARMARFGINIVRFHHMDSQPVPRGLLQKDMRTLDADMLERLDYFIAALKREGIYSDLNLHVGRKYPGFKDWGEDTPKYWKGVDNFYPPMIAMQREFARDLLLHRNPWTGNRYIEEPAVALIEINNENGLLREWRTGGLNGITEPYRGELQRQWQSWLRAKYPDTSALRAAWGLREEALGAEMLTATPNVKGGEAGWNLQLVESAKARLSTTPDGVLDLAMTAPSRENWHTQLHQNRLAFKADQPYTLTLRLRADKPTRLALQVMQAHAPWQHLWAQTIEVGTGWQDFRISFAPTQGDEVARLTLGGLGQLTGQLQIATASLRPGGVLGLKPGESLEAGTVDIIGSGDLMSRTRAGQQDWIQFLWDVESGYWRGFQAWLREELGAKPLIVGTQVSYSPAPIQAALDVVDGHAYWQHPNFPGKPWDIDNWKIANTPMAGVDGAGTLADLALRRVPGKPFIVTEYNHSAPSHFQGEALPLVAAYGALQDWDGIFLYSFGAHDQKWDSGMIDRFFDSHANPVKMTSFLSAAALFRRGDIRAAQALTQAQPAQQAWIDALRASYKMPGADSLGAPRNAVLQGAVNISTPAAAPLPLPVRSETGELLWGLAGIGGKTVIIDSPRSKGLIGARLGQPFDAHGVELELLGARNDWGVLMATLIEGRDFASPGKVLISALGQVENSGQRWLDDKKTTVGRNFGSAPTVVEGLAARVTLPVEARRVRAWALDERGNRREEIKVGGSERATLEIGEAWRTLWYEVEIK